MKRNLLVSFLILVPLIASAQVGVITPPAGGGSGTVTLGGATSGFASPTIIASVSNALAAYTLSGTGTVLPTTISPTFAAGSLASTVSALAVTGTTSTAAANQIGVKFAITGAGSAGSVSLSATRIDLLAGWTGAGGNSNGLFVRNNSAGTATAWSNRGATLMSGASTAGTNVGALMAATNASGSMVGGLAWLGDIELANPADPPGSVAFIADNGSVAVDIFQARDNGVVKFKITDGGQPVYVTTVPVVSNTSANSCGTTAATIAGTMETGIITVGATAGTSCTVTFGIAAPTRRQCSVNNETTANLARSTASSTTVSLFEGTFVAGDILAYQCSVY